MPKLAEITIRPATLADLETLVKLRVAILLELDILKDNEMELMEPKFKDWIQSNMNRGELLCWLAEYNGNIVGVAKVFIYDAPPQSPRNFGKGCYIFGIYTTPEMRGLGLATKMTQHTVNELKNSGYQFIWLMASEFGKSIYEKLGFVSSGNDHCEFMRLKSDK